MKTKQRIREFVYHFGEDSVYVSFSGGKDSTVLLDLVWSEFPNVPAVFCNTGVEFPEIVQFVKWVQTFGPVEIIRPKLSFKQVLAKYGYPVVSKEQSQFIYEYRHTKSDYMKWLRMNGKAGYGKISEKWKYLTEAPFEVSHKCCYALKKSPMNKYAKSTDKHMIVGTTASESQRRLSTYLKYGCNVFEEKSPRSAPMSFWTDQDVLAYIKEKHLPICSVYGDIEKTECGHLTTTGEARTGCMFCAFGAHLEKGENRYQRLKRTHPKLWKVCMDRFGFREVLEYIHVPIEPEDETTEDQ